MKKLFKYNMLAFKKSQILVSSIILIGAIVALVLKLALENVTNTRAIVAISYVNGLVLATVYVSFVVIILLTFIQTIGYFHKKVLSDEGYLTHTLPVENKDIINTIIITHLIYFVLNIVTITLASLIMNKFSLNNILFGFFMNITKTSVFVVVLLFFISQTILLGVFASYSIGYSKAKSKNKSSITNLVIFYVVVETLIGGAVIALALLGLVIKIDPVIFNVIMLGGVILVLVVVIVVSYYITNNYTKNKLNLE